MESLAIFIVLVFETVVATILPYSIAFLTVWTVLLVIWMMTGLLLGPGGGLYLSA